MSADAAFLAPYRVLDVTDHRGLLAGHMLAQLGADVVQLEGTRGSPARRVGPFAPDWPAGENSLYWAAYAAGKRSVVCDPEVDPACWRQLVAAADFLLDSHAPCEGRPAWLDHAAVAAINPGIVHVSITPFGLTGPKRDWVDSEITLWAAGGPLHLTRDHQDKPVRISVPQAYLHAAASAVGAALTAHADRVKTGIGQHVDLAVVQSLPQCTLGAMLAQSIGHRHFVPRPKSAGGAGGALDLSGSGSLTRRSKWPVADGLAELHLAMGPATGGSTNKLFDFLRERGALSDISADWDWTQLHKRIQAGEITVEAMEQVRGEVGSFLKTLHKRDLLPIAIERGIRIAPIDTIADLVASPQFAARNFIAEVDGEFGRYRLPGAFAANGCGGFASATAAPKLGQHSEQVQAEWQPRPAHPAATCAVGGPLDGLKVLDLAWVVAGPLIGRNLADFGATVIRVESSRRVETARLMGPFPQGKFDVQQSALYETCNAGKLGLSLDLSKEAARDVVRDLVRWADLVVESFTPGQMARWGLSYAELSAINPDIVMLSTSLAGQDGPYAAYSGYGNHGAAIAGFQNIVGRIDGPVVGPYGPYTDFVAPRFGLVAALAALDHRRRTGRGCHLDVSQTEASVQFLAAQIADYSVTGHVHERSGNRDPAMAPHGVFAAKGDDQWVAIAVSTNSQWQSLAKLIGGSALQSDQRFATVEQRKIHEDELELIVGDWVSSKTPSEIEELLQSHGIAANSLVSVDSFASDPQMIARGHLVSLPHPLSGTAVIEAAPFALSRTPAAYQRCAPPFGRDNDTVLRSILGYDDARIAALASADAIA